MVPWLDGLTVLDDPESGQPLEEMFRKIIIDDESSKIIFAWAMASIDMLKQPRDIAQYIKPCILHVIQIRGSL